jgi:hypothetical protein
MAWSNKQKQLAVRACKAAGISDEQRVDMILRNFKHAHHDGEITSTSPKLTGHHFEAFMAIAENFAGGKILHFTEGFWKSQATDGLKRMRYRAKAIAAELEGLGKLAAGGRGLSGWIEKRVSGGAATTVEELDYHGLQALIIGLEAYARSNAPKEATNAPA